MKLLRADGSAICLVTNIRTVTTVEGTILEGDVPMNADLRDPTGELVIENMGERMRFLLRGIRRTTPIPGRESPVVAARVQGILR